MSKDPESPFNWHLRKRPSVFAQDAHFRAKADGKTDSQRVSDVVQAKQVDGKSPPVVYGLNKKEREKAVLAFRHFGEYTRAVPSTKKPNKHEK
ncbi:MAG: hypothetical protein ACKO0Z_19490 [Betaproteobacteria bacterium]